MDSKVRERRRLVKRERGHRRAGLIFLGVLAVVAAIAFVWLRSSSVFAVETVTASATQHVTNEQIAKAVAEARGVSLLKVSTGAVQKSLAALPYVRSIHVYRRFPNALEIQIEEYQPVARVQTGDGKIWLAAEDGRLLEKIPASGARLLPLVVSTTQFDAHAGGALPQVVVAAVPVAQLLETPDIASRLPTVQDVSVSSGGEVVVHLQGGTELRLGEPTDLKSKIILAAQIIQKNLRDGKSLEYVDASAGGHVDVKPK